MTYFLTDFQDSIVNIYQNDMPELAQNFEIKKERQFQGLLAKYLRAKGYDVFQEQGRQKDGKIDLIVGKDFPVSVSKKNFDVIPVGELAVIELKTHFEQDFKVDGMPTKGRGKEGILKDLKKLTENFKAKSVSIKSGNQSNLLEAKKIQCFFVLLLEERTFDENTVSQGNIPFGLKILPKPNFKEENFIRWVEDNGSFRLTAKEKSDEFITAKNGLSTIFNTIVFEYNG